MRKTLVVANPVAGVGNVAKLLPQVQAELRQAGIAFDLVETRASLHAVQIAWEAPLQGYERIITVGGDGIVHEVVNGLLRASNEGETITLGIIPLGTGNDFIKSLPPALSPGANRDDWRAAIARLAADQTMLVDVGRIVGDRPAPGHPHPHYFANGMDVGFGAMVARHVKTVPGWLPPTAIYLVAILKILVNYHLPRLKMALDDEPPFDFTTTMTIIANGRCFGASFWLTPQAEIEDGRFDVMMADPLNRRRILGLIPRLMKGTHLNDPAVHMRRAQRVIIESPDPLAVEADGEIPFLEAHRLQVEILPKRLRVNV